jgi:hypothetical protein
MKRTSLIFFITLISILHGVSQGLSLTYGMEKLPVNATIVRTGTADSIEMTTWMMIRNESGKVMHVQEKKVELTLASGAAGSICWAGYCYNPGIYESLHPLTLGQGETKTGCFAHFTPGGAIGESLVRWVFFDKDDPNDSVSVTINYITYPSGCDEACSGRELLSQPFPNPANNEVNFYSYFPSNTKAELVGRDVSGKMVLKHKIIDQQGVISVNTSSFQSGVYYFSLLTGDKAGLVRKILVVHP